MTYQNFCVIKRIVHELMGINLSDHKQNLVYGRLSKRLRLLNLSNFDEYCAFLEAGDESELVELTNAITTNLTAFFRESYHFIYLKEHLVPQWLAKNASQKRLRIWSAGCSTGEEAYSIAMVLAAIPELRTWDIKILATDLDSSVIQQAKQNVYSADKLASVPSHYQRFIRYNQGRGGIEPGVASKITFKQLNLLHDWPMSGPFDLIFCRNVVIYFDQPTQTKLFDRYANILTRDGHLFIGHSENLNAVCTRFKNIGKTMYQRIE